MAFDAIARKAVKALNKIVNDKEIKIFKKIVFIKDIKTRIKELIKTINGITCLIE